jgi:hypothetical protein
MTRSKLRDLAYAGGVLRWYHLADDSTGIEPVTRPLFIVTGDGRGIVANQSTLDKARGRHRDPDTRVLCITPASDGAGDPHQSGWERGLK